MDRTTSTSEIQTMGSEMIVLNIYKGVADHFHMRLSEWLMLWPSFGIGVVLLATPDMFSQAGSFEQLAKWADESTWAVLVLGCVILRLIALVVNGTFPTFQYSPQLRLLAALTALAFWSQYCNGVLVAAFAGVGVWSAPVMYSTAVVFEIANVFRSVGDISRGRK